MAQFACPWALFGPLRRRIPFLLSLLQVSAEVKSFSISPAEASGIRKSFIVDAESHSLKKSLNTEGALVKALKHCFLFQGLFLHSLSLPC